MEERPEETRIDEEQDVEGHKAHGKNVSKEEGDDVEAHGPQHGAPQHGAPQHGQNDDEGDDVEAHSHFGAPQHGKPQHG